MPAMSTRCVRGSGRSCSPAGVSGRGRPASGCCALGFSWGWMTGTSATATESPMSTRASRSSAVTSRAARVGVADGFARAFPFPARLRRRPVAGRGTASDQSRSARPAADSRRSSSLGRCRSESRHGVAEQPFDVGDHRTVGHQFVVAPDAVQLAEAAMAHHLDPPATGRRLERALHPLHKADASFAEPSRSDITRE